MRTTHFLWLTLILLASHPAHAQLRGTPLGPGTSVRVSPLNADASRGWIEGRVVYADADSLVIHRRDRNTAATFRRDEIGALQVAVLQSRTGTAARYGLVAGLAVGGAGAVMGALSYDEDSNDGFLNFSRGEKAAMVGVFVGIPAAVIGAIAGAASPGDRWTATTLPAIPAVTVRADGTIRVALSLRW